MTPYIQFGHKAKWVTGNDLLLPPYVWMKPSKLSGGQDVLLDLLYFWSLPQKCQILQPLNINKTKQKNRNSGIRIDYHLLEEFL